MKVRLKTHEQLKKMIRCKEIKLHHVSDDGEVSHYGTLGNPSHTLTVWYDNMGKEFLVVDHPNIITKESYEKRKMFFDEISTPVLSDSNESIIREERAKAYEETAKLVMQHPDTKQHVLIENLLEWAKTERTKK